MEQTKIYTREDIRNLWRRYKHKGDMGAGTDFALIAFAQGQTYKAFQAEIDKECRQEDEQVVSTAYTTATPGQCRRAGVLLWEKAQALERRRPGLSDQVAFKLALLENPTLAEQYTGCPVRRDGQSDVAKFLDKGDSRGLYPGSCQRRRY